MSEDLLRIIKRLELRIVELEQENVSLKDRLGLNSSNSSIPSFKDLYKVERSKRSTGRHIGGQPGHKGHYRDSIPADEVVKIDLPAACDCGGVLSLSQEPYIHQRVNLSEIEPYVVEYHLSHGRCRKCGKRRTSQLPQEAGKEVFGPRVKAALSSLSGFYKNSTSEVATIFKDLFNLNVSTGSISNNEARVADKCRDTYYNIGRQVNDSPVVHIDETSHYESGKLGWGWIFTSAQASLLKLTSSRGKTILEQSPFGESDSIYVTDRYAAYNYFAKENRQIC